MNILRSMSYGVEISGRILYHHQDGVVDLASLSRSQMRPYRSDIQMIFQDPYSSLNPIRTVAEIVAEPLRIHGIYDQMGGERWVNELMDLVGLSSSMTGRFPREFSGGQRQRIGIARALALKPRLLILDEPVAALDVSIQAQIINLLQDLQRELGLAYLFIAHDLSVVRHISDRVAVMYLGRMAELAESEELYHAPLHPYTRALLSAEPVPDPTKKHERILLEGDVPTPINPPSGCVFHTRCWLAEERCKTTVPEFRDVGGGHFVAEGLMFHMPGHWRLRFDLPQPGGQPPLRLSTDLSL